MSNLIHNRHFKREIDQTSGNCPGDPDSKFESYFKLGVSKDFILIRDDFPMTDITPGEFSRLCLEMFAKNDEALHGK